MISNIQIVMPAHTKEPNANGTIFDEKALKKALKNFIGIPIIDRSCGGNIDITGNISEVPSVIGVINEGKLNKRKDTIKLKGQLINTDMGYTIDKKTGDINIMDISLMSFGEQGE